MIRLRFDSRFQDTVRTRMRSLHVLRRLRRTMRACLAGLSCRLSKRLCTFRVMDLFDRVGDGPADGRPRGGLGRLRCLPTQPRRLGELSAQRRRCFLLLLLLLTARAASGLGRRRGRHGGRGKKPALFVRGIYPYNDLLGVGRRLRMMLIGRGKRRSRIVYTGHIGFFSDPVLFFFLVKETNGAADTRVSVPGRQGR